MELDLFRSFVAVADARSFTRAAKILHISQPALSRQIARMEHELGGALFERYGRHVECTRAGEVLLPLARAVVTRADDAITVAREHFTTEGSSARLAATAAVLGRFLGPVLAKFVADYPDISLSIVEGQDGHFEEEIISGRVDCAVMTVWGAMRVATRHLFTEDILLVVPEGHRFATYPCLDASMLKNQPILLPDLTSNAASVVVDWFRSAGVEPTMPKMAYRVGTHPELIKSLVALGVGLAPMPRMLALALPLDGLVAVPFREDFARELALAYSRERVLPSGVRVLMAYIESAARRAAPRLKTGTH